MDQQEQGIGIVVGEFNEEITSVMLETAKKTAELLKLPLIEVIKVPGVYDAPLVVQHLLEKKDIAGVAVLGAVIQGSTDHDVLVANTCAHACTQLSLQYEKPVMLGVIGPRASYEAADARKEEYGRRAIVALDRMLTILKGKKI